MKKIFFIAAFVIAAVTCVSAQEVEYKDGKILVDGKAMWKCDKINAIEYSFYTLEGDDEVLSLRFSDNGTPRSVDDDYIILNFLTQKTKVETTDVSRIASGFNQNKMIRKLIAWLLKDKVIATDGTFNRDKLDNFYQKYNENITTRK